MRPVVCAAMALIYSALPAQTPAAKPEFEVASVRPVAQAGPDAAMPALAGKILRNMRPAGAIPLAAPDRISLKNWNLVDLIGAAYSVRPAQVSGPAWMSDQGFDIEAKIPDGASRQDVHAMLQSLLEERFGLKMHRGTQTEQGFALVVGKDGPKLEPAIAAPAPGEGLTEDEVRDQRMKALKQGMRQVDADGGGGLQSWDSISTEALAAQLVKMAGGPVIDATGLMGRYHVTLRTSNSPDVPGSTVFDAVEKLGLKLEPRKVTVETVVVDQVSRTPTEN